MSNTNNNKRRDAIAFWEKESGNLMSKASGLTDQEVTFLQSLKPGDRLIMFFNNPTEAKNPTFNMVKYLGPAANRGNNDSGF